MDQPSKSQKPSLPEDHYVAQTYLRRFTNQKGKIWVYDKQRLEIRERATKSVCKEQGGSNNPYFTKDRVLEDYLQIFETRWPKAMEVFLAEGPLDLEIYRQAKRVIAGYLAYLRFSTPAATSAGQTTLASHVKDALKIMKDKGELPPPPKGLEFLRDDIENQACVDVDPKYPQALGAKAMLDVSDILYNSPWMRIFNKTGDSFLTSDNPACMWYPNPSKAGLLYLPLSPTVAVLIGPEPESGETLDHSKDGAGEAKPHFVPEMNEHIVKCASNVVISSERSEATRDLVSKFRDWSYACVTQKLPVGNSVLSDWRRSFRTSPKISEPRRQGPDVAIRYRTSSHLSC